MPAKDIFHNAVKIGLEKEGQLTKSEVRGYKSEVVFVNRDFEQFSKNISLLKAE